MLHCRVNMDVLNLLHMYLYVFVSHPVLMAWRQIDKSVKPEIERDGEEETERQRDYVSDLRSTNTTTEERE